MDDLAEVRQAELKGGRPCPALPPWALSGTIHAGPWGDSVTGARYHKLKKLSLASLYTFLLAGLTTAILVGGPMAKPEITWRDEFNSPLELSTDETPRRWRTRGCDDGGLLSQGYRDHAGSSWNISPIEHPNNSPFRVDDGVLTITAERNPGLSGVSEPWVGGILVSDPNAGHSFTYGYFEIRMRLPNPGPGMFPALWLFANSPGDSTSSKRAAEIDIFEVFGDPEGAPWASTLRRMPSPGDDQLVGRHDEETRDWHRYGLEWTPDVIRFYRDGHLRHEVTGDSARWFRDMPMGIRLNYAMDPAWDGPMKSTTMDPPPGTELHMEVDYVRHYDKKPKALAIGSADPEVLIAPSKALPSGASSNKDQLKCGNGAKTDSNGTLNTPAQ